MPGLAMGFFVAGVGCSGDDDVTTPTGGDGTDDTTTQTGPTYHRDVAPIFNQKCTGCHQEGGIGPFLLTEYEPARERRFLALPT